MIIGNGTINTMKQNWDKYCPAIISSCVQNQKAPPSSLNALALLDKQFRTGPTAKHTGAYQIYEVHTVMNLKHYNHHHHSIEWY